MNLLNICRIGIFWGIKLILGLEDEKIEVHLVLALYSAGYPWKEQPQFLMIHFYILLILYQFVVFQNLFHTMLHFPSITLFSLYPHTLPFLEMFHHIWGFSTFQHFNATMNSFTIILTKSLMSSFFVAMPDLLSCFRNRNPENIFFQLLNYYLSLCNISLLYL